MSNYSEVMNFSAQNLFYIGLVIAPISIFIKWGLTPRNFIEFIDFIYERKLKKLDHDLAYFSENDVQKKILERERIFLINAHHTGIYNPELQEIILKTIANSNGTLRLNAYKQASDYLQKKDGHILIKPTLVFWLNWLFILSYSFLLGLFALLLIIPTITNFLNHNYGTAFGSFLLMIFTIAVMMVLLVSRLKFKKIKRLNSLLQDEQKIICEDHLSLTNSNVHT